MREESVIVVDPEIIRIKDQAWESLSKIPGVHAVGIGTKVVAGNRTDELAITVFVVKKRSVGDLEAEEVIPLTIEGLKTDVIEVAVPHILRAEPNITRTIQPLPAPDSGASIILSTRTGIDPVPEGEVVIISVIATPTIPTPTNPVRTFYSDIETTGKIRLSMLAELLAAKFHGDMSIKASYPDNTTQIDIKAKPGFTAAVSCYVLTMDLKRYSDFLRGGIRVSSAEPGTLGCLATTTTGAVVALTNQHVVCAPSTSGPSHLAEIGPSTSTVNINFRILSPPPHPEHTLVIVGFDSKVTSVPSAFAFYTTVKGDTANPIARGITEAINNSSVPGFSATQDNDIVNATGPRGPGIGWLAASFGPTQRPPRNNLHVVIEKPDFLTKILTFTGGVSKGDHYGVYVRVNPGGTLPTFGVFADPAGLGLDGIAQKVSTEINSLPPSVSGLVWATAVGPRVTIKRAQEIECFIQADIRVGQPVNIFVWPCSQRIGRVIDARLNVDAALIQLDPGLKYKPQIQGIGPVDGFLPASSLLLGLAVQKSGFVSGVTTGKIISLATSGFIGARGPGEVQGAGGWRVFKRIYKNALIIESTTIEDSALGTLQPFIVGGDSGAALVTAGEGPVKVVGLLFGGDETTTALATPIEQVIDAFKEHNLSFALAPGQDPDAIQTVPQPGIAFQGLDHEAEARATPSGFVVPAWANRMSEAESEITATNLGREYAGLVRRHFAEAQTLVNNNRRVGTIWRRSGGPEILNALWNMIHFREERMPSEINGKPLADCLARIQQVLTRYASPDFSFDLSRYAPMIANFSGMTYQEMLAALQSESTE